MYFELDENVFDAKHALILKMIDLSHDKVNIKLKFILLLGYF